MTDSAASGRHPLGPEFPHANHDAHHHDEPQRFSRVLTVLYTVAVVGFLSGAVLFYLKPESAHGEDAPIDVADVVLLASWAVLVVAALVTAARTWRTPHTS